MSTTPSDLPLITVELMRPEDAAGVADLFRAVYGEGYPVADYYHPERLIAANREGRIISSVARTPEGRVVGHNALYHQAPHPRTYESGAGLVLPEFRVANLFGRLVRHVIEVGGPRFGAEMIWGESVCNHVFTQRLAVSMNYVVMALEVDLMPAAAYAKEASAEGRVSCAQQFQTQIPYPHYVYLPERYARQITSLYEGFDDQREFKAASAPLPAGAKTRLDSHIFDYAQVARITLWQADQDLDQALAAAEAQAARRGVVVFQLWLNLGEPWAGAAVEVLRGRGYFLGGLLPRWFGTDGLLMQKLKAAPNWGTIQILEGRNQAVLEMVRADWEGLA